MTQLYPLAPAAEPGEDDLGAISSWYVWAALGLYPETPGVADPVMTSPLFPRVTITEGNGHTVTITGTHAPDAYIQHGTLAIGSGGSSIWNKPWIPASALSEGAVLALDLGPTPNDAWGSSASAVPPSFSRGAAPAVPFTTPGGSVTVPANGVATVQLGVQEGEGAASHGSVRTVAWHVVPSSGATGVRVSPTSGTLRVVDGRSTTPLQVTSGSPGTWPVTIDLNQGSDPLPSLTLDVDADS